VASGIAGAIGTELDLYSFNPVLGGAVEGAIQPVLRDLLKNRAQLDKWCWKNTLRDALLGAIVGGATAGIGDKIVKSSPKISGRFAEGLRYLTSKKAIRQYRELTKDLLQDSFWSGLEEVFNVVADQTGLSWEKDLCANDNTACTIPCASTSIPEEYPIVPVGTPTPPKP
jgi:hypothetical protein